MSSPRKSEGFETLMGKKEHLRQAPALVNIGIITVTTTRSAETDKSGQWIKRLAGKEGHRVIDYRIVTDDRHAIVKAVTTAIDMGLHILITNGGTGISPSDVTIEAIRPLFVKEMTAFSTLFSRLSFEEIDSAAILSRATAGVIGNTVVFCIPGSLNACKLACKELIFPEAKHIAAHLAN